MKQLNAEHKLLAAVSAAISWAKVGARLPLPDESDIALIGSRGLRGAYFMHEREVPPAVARDRAIWANQRAALIQLLCEAEDRAVSIHVYKGAQLCEKYFGSMPLCAKGDVDVLVLPQDEGVTRTLLADLGYVQADYDTNSLELAPCSREVLDKHEKNNYSLKSFVRLEEIDWAGRAVEPVGYSRPVMNTNERCQLLMTIDVAIGLDAAIDCAPLFARATSSAFGIGKALSPEDHYWYLCSLFYLKMFQFKSKAKLAPLCEIGGLLAAEHKTMDWDYLVGVARRYDLFPPLFYLTSFLNELAELDLPWSVLEALDPRHGTRTRDFGWQLPKVLGAVDTFPKELLPPRATVSVG